jgi:hypothetical protein
MGVALAYHNHSDGVLVPDHRDYDIIQITLMRSSLIYQNHFDGAPSVFTEVLHIAMALFRLENQGGIYQDLYVCP